MKRPTTYSQKRRASRGGRAAEDAAYDRQRARDPTLARAAAIRNSTAWRNIRRSQLRREPLCRPCKGKRLTTAATQVDHIVPLRADFDLAFVRSNLQSICTSCHAVKSQQERREA